MKAQLYQTYLFKDKDPVIDQLRTLINDNDLSYQDLYEASGVTVSTLRAWFEGKVRRPQSSTIEAVGRACGHERIWMKMRGKNRR